MTVRRVVVFGRQPVPGRGKSRLAAAIGEEDAAEISQVLLEHTLRVAVGGSWQAELHLADPVQGSWTPTPALPLQNQSRGSIGERMAAAFSVGFQQGVGETVLIGSDCPGLRCAHLETAFRWLEERPVVLGPAVDGGYWLLGQKAPGLDLFSGIPWSSPDTLRATRERVAHLGAHWHELETLADVDTAGDLHRFLESPLGDHSEAQLIRDLRRVMGLNKSSSASS